MIDKRAEINAINDVDKAFAYLNSPSPLKTLTQANFCKKYAIIKPMIPGIVLILNWIPVYGAKIATVLSFLAQGADQMCAVK